MLCAMGTWRSVILVVFIFCVPRTDIRTQIRFQSYAPRSPFFKAPLVFVSLPQQSPLLDDRRHLGLIHIPSRQVSSEWRCTVAPARNEDRALVGVLHSTEWLLRCRNRQRTSLCQYIRPPCQCFRLDSLKRTQTRIKFPKHYYTTTKDRAARNHRRQLHNTAPILSPTLAHQNVLRRYFATTILANTYSSPTRQRDTGLYVVYV